MKKLILILFLFTLTVNFLSAKGLEKLKVGDNVPSFELKDQNGELFQVSSVIGQKNLVIYFYPKDNSPICTKQACSFRDQYHVFKQKDAIVIGISGQSTESHKDFANENRLNFILLSDKDNSVRKLFGVPSTAGVIPGRVTYIVNKKGEIVYIFNSQFDGEKHVEEALKILNKLEPNK